MATQVQHQSTFSNARVSHMMASVPRGTYKAAACVGVSALTWFALKRVWTSAFSSSTKQASSSSGTRKTLRCPFRFQIVNDAGLGTDTELNKVLATYPDNYESINEQGSQALMSISSEYEQLQRKKADERTQQRSLELQALMDGDSTNVVQVHVVAASHVHVRGKPPAEDVPLVNISIQLATPDVRASGRQMSAKSVAHSLQRRRAWLYTFVDGGNDDHPFSSQLLLLTRFVDTVVRRARPGHDRVMVRVTSPGGGVHEYGLAAAQLERIRRAGIYLVVCVDEMAASGGYMMAAVAHRIVASPFALVGSIGVVVQFFNMRKLLERVGVHEKTFTAGDDKRLVSQFSDYGPEADSKMKEQLVETHRVFQRFVSQYRPQVNVDATCTGKTWVGTDALEQELVDDLMTSDEYVTLLLRDHLVIQAVPFAPKEPETSLWALVFGEEKKEDEDVDEISANVYFAQRGRSSVHRILSSIGSSMLRGLDSLASTNGKRSGPLIVY